MADTVKDSEGTGFGDFEKVESRKRKAGTDTEMEDRPYFAPISAEKMSSNKKGAPDVRRGILYTVYII